MRAFSGSLLLACLLARAEEPGALVEASAAVEDLLVELRYASERNFLGRKVYPAGARCLLLNETAKRLQQAARALRPRGYRLKVYDCYRPRAVQWEMWKLFPRPGYVADPRQGSNHNRGAAVDLTLVTLEGAEVEMPTPFDTFSRAAHHAYTGGSEASRRHRELLREAMEAAGFRKNRLEWWHYELPGASRFPLLEVPLESAR